MLIYSKVGTEYSRECYCGNSFSAGAVAAPEADCQNTDFLCMGDDEEFCGGSLLLSVYKRYYNQTIKGVLREGIGVGLGASCFLNLDRSLCK
jgi:hypothetical protein